jgi:hypothetical protein
VVVYHLKGVFVKFEGLMCQTVNHSNHSNNRNNPGPLGTILVVE